MIKPFFDTNVLLYLLSSDIAKAGKAEELLRKGDGTISVQVLNEFATVTLRKVKMPWPKIRAALAVMRASCHVVPLTLELHEEGLNIAERYGFTLYDSLIVVAAIHSGCDTLYSEDMQDKQVIRSITIRNPFKPN